MNTFFTKVGSSNDINIRPYNSLRSLIKYTLKIYSYSDNQIRSTVYVYNSTLHNPRNSPGILWAYLYVNVCDVSKLRSKMHNRK